MKKTSLFWYWHHSTSLLRYRLKKAVPTIPRHERPRETIAVFADEVSNDSEKRSFFFLIIGPIVQVIRCGIVELVRRRQITIFPFYSVLT